jgi:hypothetical protein
MDKKLPRVKPGDPIRAAHWNTLCDIIESMWLIPSAPLQLQRTPHGTAITVAIGDDDRFAKTQEGGIPARDALEMGEAEVDLYELDADDHLKDSEKTVTACNWSGTAIPQDRYILIRKIGKNWRVVAVECVSA